MGLKLRQQQLEAELNSFDEKINKIPKLSYIIN